MIFVDSNVPMYLIGAPHPHKDAATRILNQLVALDEPLVTDAEVFQELMHRYAAQRRLDAIPHAFETLRVLVTDVLPVTFADMQDAKDIFVSNPGISARDAVHLGAMKNHAIRRIVSFDRDFDSYPGIERLS